MVIEFEFVNNGEFGNPYYQVLIDGASAGYIFYIAKDEQWKADIFRCLSSVDCFVIGLKIEDLNESLAKQRKEYFGLI